MVRTRLGGLAANGRSRRRLDRVRAGAALGGVATAVVVGGWLGLGLAVAVAAGLEVLLHRLEPAAARRRRLRETADLPMAADLMAAALRSGAPVDRAVGCVGQALGGPLGERLATVGRELRLGGEPADAWRHVAGVPGGDRLASAAVRSARSGAAMAGALSRVAEDLRGERAAAAEAAARRAGVLVVLPLGLCFLPAFVLAGLVPVIVAVLGDVLVTQ
ncbi:MAG TPA: type II secretion system F family protein [Micromonosporaceae bacterium]|nr:type II secretion system F family protein [Micromonosporaceae bacterium]